MPWFQFDEGYRRFHGRGRHPVGRAKNSDGLGRVIVWVQNGGERIQVRRLFALNRYVPARFPLLRGLSKSGKKDELVAKAFGAYELNVPVRIPPQILT